MRPDNIRQAITLYQRYRNEVIPSRPFIILRRVLRNCFFGNMQSEITLRTGNVPSQATFCQIFDDGITKYIPPYEWRNLPVIDLDGLFTVDDLDFPILVPYEIDFEFPAEWGTSAVPENNFIRDTPQAIRVVSAQDNRRGTARSWHILLRGG